jgi:hypothetical protein
MLGEVIKEVKHQLKAEGREDEFVGAKVCLQLGVLEV